MNTEEFNPKNPKKPRKPQYKPIPDDQKKLSGRPRKYDRVVVEDENGNKTTVCVEVDKKRYWFVHYTYIHFGVTYNASITFETKKNMIFSLYDLCQMVGNRNLTITWFYEFVDFADYKEFSRKEPLENNGMDVLQV